MGKLLRKNDKNISWILKIGKSISLLGKHNMDTLCEWFMTIQARKDQNQNE